MKKVALRPPGKKFPVTVARGMNGVKGSAKIYRTPVVVKGTKYDSYTVESYAEGRRTRKRFQSYDKAFAEAETIAIKLANGERAALELKGEDRRVYLSTVQTIQQLLSSAGDLPASPSALLGDAIREYAEARTILGSDSIIDAAKYYVRHARTVTKSGKISEVLAQMIEELKKLGRGDYHRRDINRHLVKFIEAVGDLPVAKVVREDVKGFLDGIPGSPKTHNNCLGSLHNFFKFARTVGYLPRDLPSPADGFSIKTVVAEDAEVFTPEEAYHLLNDAPERMIPCLALKFFSGVRTEEMYKIEWDAVKFGQDVITISAAVAKKNQRRIIPLLPNAKAWLLPFQGSSGRIAARWGTAHTLSKSWVTLADRIKVDYKKNAMRNSYISYRLAGVKNLDQVAMESGNSATVIRREYLEIVTEGQAQRWFAISPGKELPQ